MNRILGTKIGLVLGLMALLLIPIGMIRGLVDERAARRDGVLEDIARASSGAQQIIGPLVVVPYTRTVKDTGTDPETKQKVVVERLESGRLYFLPERLGVDARIDTEARERGIYRAMLYHAKGKLAGHFELPAHFGFGAPPADYRFGTPLLAVGIRDIRGIENVPALRINGRTLAFRPGTAGSLLGEGVHVPLEGIGLQTGGRFEYAFDIALLGTRALELSPVGKETTVDIDADWPHPGFTGSFLPVERNIDAEGFRAHWATSFFATNMEQLLRDCTGGTHCDTFRGQTLGFSLADPVDHYLKSERALKYALLFVGLGFAAFFLFEVLKRIDVHPVQYGLVGLALAVFYLLLLSLSEHIGFAAAYAVSTLACVGLLGCYVSAVLGGARRGLAFGGGLGALYGLLYVLLGSEDYALLLGSVLVFGLLSAVMLLTRGVDWNAVSLPRNVS
jgi:inner membrane protein